MTTAGRNVEGAVGKGTAAGDGQMTPLAQSYAFCERLTRRAARNFYFGIKLLPEPKRSAMFALYAYMRLADDIADATGRSHQQRIDDLEAWRQRTHQALQGNIHQQPATHAGPYSGDEFWPAFADMARQYAIPPRLFDDMIAGQQQDLQPVELKTFDDLSDYCYRVAGVVGLASIHVWGFSGGAETQSLAIARGLAFQLTNVLRDLREDMARGRLYLPLQDMEKFAVDRNDLLRGGGNFERLMRFEIDRAREFYDRSSPLEARIEADSRPTLAAMTRIYRGLLDKIARKPGRVLDERVSLSLFAKLRIAWRAARSEGGAAKSRRKTRS